MEIKKLKNIEPSIINHGDGKKFVFESLGFKSDTFTQSAYGSFKKGEYCDEHFHESMIEIFFFLKGNGTYWINGLAHKIQPGTYLRIDPLEKHYFKCEESDLEFFYIGIPVK